MRVVTWNCCRGNHAVKLGALAKLSADIAVVQECPRADALLCDRRGVWFGQNPKQGVAVFVAEGFEVEALAGGSTASAYGVRISGKAELNVLAVWAKPTPTYARAVLDALEEHRALLSERPSIVVGDFNTSTPLTEKRKNGGHADIVRVLAEEHKLVSAYHHFFREEHGYETRPTYYFQWNESKPFHIDYCFVPKAWAKRIRAVTVGGFAEWAKESDHRPVVVDL